MNCVDFHHSSHGANHIAPNEETRFARFAQIQACFRRLLD